MGVSSQTVRTSPIRLAGALVTRLCEILLAALGFAYVFVSGDSPREQATYLGIWDALAVTYLTVGLVVVRRQRFAPDQPGTPVPRWLAVMRGRRINYLFTLAASLTGLVAATDVLFYNDPTLHQLAVKVFGVIGVVAAWLLLHSGYARLYENLHYADAGGLRFPTGTYPNVVDFLYFSITIGVSFAVSDVEVVRRDMRWHIIVHSVVSFFYNAAVLAIAIGTVTGR